MVVRTKVAPINRDIELMLSDDLSPTAQSAQFAEYAGEQIEEAKQIDATILGRVPRYTVSVDGQMDAPLTSVKSDGVIVAEFELIDDVLKWIADQLETHSPVKTGRYQKSHTLFADGTEIDVGAVISPADVYTFINDQPYARKIERGSSSQAPDGVYQAVAHLAAARFGNIAKISFTFQAFLGGAIGAWAATTKMSSKGHAAASSRAEWLSRQPAIIVQLPR
jgi:hypothetical protein